MSNPDLSWQSRPITITGVDSKFADGTGSQKTWAQLRDHIFGHHRVQADKDKNGFLAVRLKDERPGTELYPEKVKTKIDPDTKQPKLGRDGNVIMTKPKNVTNANIAEVFAVVFDVDGGQSYADATARLVAKGVAHFGYSSYSHGQPRDDEAGGKVKFRIVIPLASSFVVEGIKTPTIWSRVVELVGEHFGVKFDPACTNIARVFYLPANDGGEVAKAAEVRDFTHFDKAPLDLKPFVDKALMEASKVRTEREAKKAEDEIADTRLAGLLDAFWEDIDPSLFLEKVGRVCPNEDQHTEGPTGADKLFCYDAGAVDGNGGVRETPYIGCPHAHCEKISTRDMIARVAARDGLSRADLAECIVDDDRRGAFLSSAVIPDGFFISDGMICTSVGRDARELPVCSVFEVTGRIRDERSGDWGRELQFATEDGARKSVVILDADVHGDAKGVRARLAGEGLRIEIDRAAVGAFERLLNSYTSDKRITAVSKPGWHGKVFVTPIGDVIGTTSQGEVWRLADKAGAENRSKGGTLEGWKAGVGDAVWHDATPHFALGLMAGCAGPILELIGEDSCGLHFMGPTSRGKSTAQTIQASVWTSPKPGDGVLTQCRGTDNAMEFVFARGNGCTLAFDEGRAGNPKLIAGLAFQLAGGTTKRRMTPGITERRVQTWTTFGTLSTEKPMGHFVNAAGDKMVAGQVVRLPSVDVGGLQPIEPAAAKAIKDAALANYGHVGPEFVRTMMRIGYGDDPGKLRGEIDKLTEMLPGRNQSPATERAARVFGVLLAAGCIMKVAGLVPEHADVATPVLWAWDRFLTSSEAAALRTGEDAVDKLLLWLRANPHVVRKVGDKYAHREIVAWYDDHTVYIPADNIDKIDAVATTWRELSKELLQRKILRTSGPRNVAHTFIPQVGRFSHYRLEIKIEMDNELADGAGADAGALARRRKGDVPRWMCQLQAFLAHQPDPPPFRWCEPEPVSTYKPPVRGN